jgi:hypothetical protein
MNIEQDLVFNIFGGHIYFWSLHSMFDEIDVVHFETSWKGSPVLGLIDVVGVLDTHNLVVLDQTVMVLLFDVELVIVQSGFISDLMSDELSVVS